MTTYLINVDGLIALRARVRSSTGIQPVCFMGRTPMKKRSEKIKKSSKNMGNPPKADMLL
jgi:hypothetical protein